MSTPTESSKLEMPQVNNWVSRLGASNFRIIMQSLIPYPNESSFQRSLDAEERDLKLFAPVHRENIPGHVTQILSPNFKFSGVKRVFGPGDLNGQLRTAYVTAFRSWLKMQKLTRMEKLTVEAWAFLSDSSKGLSEIEEEAHDAGIECLQSLYVKFQEELVNTCKAVSATLNDPKVVSWKKGRYVLKHEGATKIEDPGVFIKRSIWNPTKSGSIWRTPDGHLVPKVSFTGHFGGVRGELDWGIAIEKASCEVQSKAFVSELAAKLDAERNTNGVGIQGLIDQAEKMADFIRAITVATWGTSYREAFATSYRVWSDCVDELGEEEFLPVATLAQSRIEAASIAMARQQPAAREHFAALEDAKAKYAGKKFSNADAIKKFVMLIVDGERVFKDYINAYHKVYDVQVESCRRFLDWLESHTKEVLEKMFKANHKKLWLALEAGHFTLSITKITANVVLYATGQGGFTGFVDLAFQGADGLYETFGEKIKELATEGDYEKLGDDQYARAKELMFKEVAGPQERAIREVIGRASKITKTKIFDKEGIERLEKITEGAEEVGEFSAEKINEIHEMVEDVAVSTLSMIDRVKEGVGEAGREEMEKVGKKFEILAKVTNPLELAPIGGAAGAASQIPEALSLPVRLAGDVLTLIFPPTLVDADLSQEEKDALQAAFDEMKGRLTKIDKKALRGKLEYTSLHAIFKRANNKFGKPILADSTGSVVRLDSLSLRPVDDTGEIGLKRALGGSGDYLFRSLFGKDGDEGLVYAYHRDSGKPDKDSYDEKAAETHPLVAFKKDEIRDNYVRRTASNKTGVQYFLAKNVTGCYMFDSSGHKYLQQQLPTFNVLVSPEGNCSYVDDIRPDANAVQHARAKRLVRLAEMKKNSKVHDGK